jgi:hypothetical protein
MKRLKVSKNFYLDEFVPRSIYKKYGFKSIWFLDPRLIDLAQGIRDFLGVPVTINNWMTGGRRQYSGYRPPRSSVGAYYSQHKFGRALDIKVKLSALDLHSYEGLRDIIRNNYKHFKTLGVTTIEKNTKTWLHLDMRQTNEKELFEVRIPKK